MATANCAWPPAPEERDTSCNGLLSSAKGQIPHTRTDARNAIDVDGTPGRIEMVERRDSKRG